MKLHALLPQSLLWRYLFLFSFTKIQSNGHYSTLCGTPINTKNNLYYTICIQYFIVWWHWYVHVLFTCILAGTYNVASQGWVGATFFKSGITGILLLKYTILQFAYRKIFFLRTAPIFLSSFEIGLHPLLK